MTTHTLTASTIPGRSAPPVVTQPVDPIARWRRRLTVALGLLWVLDAALQFQPFMYSAGFPASITDAAQGSPGWITAPAGWGAHLMGGHLAVWNTLFALTQLAIGIGLLIPRTLKPALAATIVWAGMVWWLGEGLGGLLAGPVTAFDGVPGAAVVYAVIAALLWPRWIGDDRSVAAASPLGRVGSAGLWIGFWGLFVFETLRPSDRGSSALHDAVLGNASGEPGWIKAIDRFAATGLDHRGLLWSLVLAGAFSLIAAAVLLPNRAQRLVIAAAIVLAVVIWVVGQNLGEMFTGDATDPNTGPLLVLLSLCYLPPRSQGLSARDHRRAVGRSLPSVLG